MKTTKWISDKLKSTEEELLSLENQIKDRNISETDFSTTTFFHKNDNPSNLTIDQMLHILIAKKNILTDILQ